MYRNSLKGANKDMRTSTEVIEIAKAMCDFQGDYEGAQKEGLNPHFKSKYITLDSIRQSIKTHMKLNGLSVMQDVTSQGNTVSVETRIQHISGQFMEFGPLTITLGKIDAQSAGSAATYAERYALCAALGISSEIDDDANAAMQDKVTPKKQEETPIALITKDQMVEMDEILKWLDKDFSAQLIYRITAKYKISDISALPLAYFPTVMKFLKDQTSEKAES